YSHSCRLPCPPFCPCPSSCCRDLAAHSGLILPAVTRMPTPFRLVASTLLAIACLGAAPARAQLQILPNEIATNVDVSWEVENRSRRAAGREGFHPPCRGAERPHHPGGGADIGAGARGPRLGARHGHAAVRRRRRPRGRHLRARRRARILSHPGRAPRRGE